jgi:hypothetical protein
MAGGSAVADVEGGGSGLSCVIREVCGLQKVVGVPLYF